MQESVIFIFFLSAHTISMKHLEDKPIGRYSFVIQKKKAPSFDQPQPSQPSFRQPPPPTTSSPSQGSQINQPKPLSPDQLQHLQQFIQHAYQAVTDYEYLYEKVPTEHTAHTIRGIIDDNKNTIKLSFICIASKRIKILK